MTDNEIAVMNAIGILRHPSVYLEHSLLEAVDIIEQEINRQKTENKELQAEIKRLKPFEKKALKPVVENLKENLELEKELKKAQAEIEALKRISPIVFGKEYKYCNLLGNVLCFSKSLDDYNDMRNGFKAEAIKEVLLTLEVEAESSDKYIREYDDSEVQRAYNKALWKSYNLVKEMAGDNECINHLLN